MDEYAIAEASGEFWGLPVKTWPTIEAALRELSFLQSRRQAQHDEAVRAVEELKQGDVDSARARDLQETIARWDREKTRVWGVVRRQVTAWEPATL